MKAAFEPRTASCASFPPLCSACGTSSGCGRHRLFTCGTCGRTVSWVDGGTEPGFENACSDCWYDAQATGPAHVATEAS